MTPPSTTTWPSLSWSCIPIRYGMAALFIVYNNARPEATFYAMFPVSVASGLLVSGAFAWVVFSRDNGVASHMIFARCGTTFIKFVNTRGAMYRDAPPCSRLDVHRLYVLSFSGSSPFSKSPQNVSRFHTRFRYLVHMIVICLTHFVLFSN